MLSSDVMDPQHIQKRKDIIYGRPTSLLAGL